MAGSNVRLIARDDVGGRTKPKSQQRSAYWSKISQLDQRASKGPDLLGQVRLDPDTDRSSFNENWSVKL